MPAMRAGRATVMMGVLLASCLRPASDCGPETCAGCCSPTGTCETGAQHAACGLNGARCSDCSSGQQCEDFVCAEAVDAGVDAGSADSSVDGGAWDAGADAGLLDAGKDAGQLDAGKDAGQLDGGREGGGLQGRLWMFAAIGPTPNIVLVQSPVGSPPTQISAPGRAVTGMAVSEDGALIAISYGSPDELFVGPTDGGPAQLVRSSIGRIRVSAISPDKGYVAFTEEHGWEDGIMIMPLDGGPTVDATPRLTNGLLGNFYQRGFSWNSRYFAASGPQNQLYITEAVTGAMTEVTVPSQTLKMAWTSGSSFMVTPSSVSDPLPYFCASAGSCAPLAGFTGQARMVDAPRNGTFAIVQRDSDAGTELVRVPLDGGPFTSVANYPIRSANFCHLWRLSADGAWLATCAATSDGGEAISLISTAGTSQPIELFTLPGVGAEQATFDPDSTQLVFRSNLETNGTSYSWGLQRIDLSTPGQPPILLQAADGGVVWSFAWTR